MNLSLTARASHLVALVAAAVASVLMALAAAPSAVAATAAAPECVQHYSGRRYSTVVNSCDVTAAVTVEYTDGQAAPCRVIEPGMSATFAGYGPQLNYVTGLRTCEPDLVEAGGA
ncbi:alpha-amylase [Streptomyces finlayi]|nr:alpha-amylase [Streptomyces finlayi]